MHTKSEYTFLSLISGAVLMVLPEKPAKVTNRNFIYVLLFYFLILNPMNYNHYVTNFSKIFVE